MLASCEPVSSSSAPHKKTEAETLQALQTAIEVDLKNAIDEEITAKRNYIAKGGTEMLVWRLLRQIVVLGQTTQKSLAELLQEWRAAKKAVEEVQKKIETLITALKTDYREAAKQAATTAKENVTAVTDAVENVRQAKKNAQRNEKTKKEAEKVQVC